MNPGSVLVIDDSEVIRGGIAEKLSSAGFEVATAADGEEAIRLGDTEKFDVVISDIVLPKVDGIRVLKFFRERHPNVPVILITGHATLETAIEAIRERAFDYILKPFRLDDLLHLTTEALAYNRERKGGRLRSQSPSPGSTNGLELNEIIGSSPAMHEVYDKIAKVSRADCTVLIQGESGTGKELIARAIHFNSRRKNKPWIPINCGAIPGELLESELFGHEKGAFTHAFRSRPGRFELAHKGTIFLDEIGEMPLTLQVKLLRVLQERCFERVGGIKTIRVDIRVIAATNTDLEDMVKKGNFREDLYYRLNVVPIEVPPLRNRLEDLEPLVKHFLSYFCTSREVPLKKISEEAMQCFYEYNWPGNVRELENLLERLVILVEGEEITLDDLPPRFKSRKELPPGDLPTEFPSTGISLKAEVEKYETQLIFKALEKANGVKSKAARLLGINRTTLLEKLRRRGIPLSSI